MFKYLLIFLLSPSFLYSSHISWQSSYEKAHKQAKKTNKKLLILIFEKHEEKNRQLLQSVFMNQIYIDKVNQHYVCVLIIKDQKESYPIENLFTIQYPALFFLDDYELFYGPPLLGNITPQTLKTHLDLNNLIRTPMR